MDRAYASGAAGSAPAAPASPSTGYPTAGNPSTGTPATKPGPYFYHMIVEELMAIITAAGITPAQGNLTQLLTALRSAGVFGTPDQFDNTTKAATTAFIKTNGMRYSGVTPFTGVLPGVVGHIGGLVYCYNAGANSYSLPDSVANNVPLGATVTIVNFGNQAMSIGRQGADQLQKPGGSYVTSLNGIPSGSLVEATLVVAGIWHINGSGVLSQSSDFSCSLAQSGYQFLPGGRIRQWGRTSTSASNTVSPALPIAFPNGILSANAWAVLNAAESPSLIVGVELATMSQTSIKINTSSIGTRMVFWEAIGY